MFPRRCTGTNILSGLRGQGQKGVLPFLLPQDPVSQLPQAGRGGVGAFLPHPHHHMAEEGWARSLTYVFSGLDHLLFVFYFHTPLLNSIWPKDANFFTSTFHTSLMKYSHLNLRTVVHFIQYHEFIMKVSLFTFFKLRYSFDSFSGIGNPYLKSFC